MAIVIATQDALLRTIDEDDSNAYACVIELLTETILPRPNSEP